MRVWFACEKHWANALRTFVVIFCSLYFVVRGREICNAFTTYTSLVVGLRRGTLAVKVKRSLCRLVRVKGKIWEIGPYIPFYTLRILYYVHCLDNDFCLVYVRFSRPRFTIRIFGFIIVVVIVRASGPMYTYTFPSVGETSRRLPRSYVVVLSTKSFWKTNRATPVTWRNWHAKRSSWTRKPYCNPRDPRMTHDYCRDGTTIIKVSQTRYTYISTTKTLKIFGS